MLKFTKCQLQSVIQAFQYFEFISDQQGKIDKSICEQILEKFIKKAFANKDKN